MTNSKVFYYDQITKHEIFNQSFRNCTPHIPQLNTLVEVGNCTFRVMDVTFKPMHDCWFIYIADARI